MFRRVSLLLCFVLLTSLVPAKDKDKNKILLPDYVLVARTVLVVVNPDAGSSLRSPNENRTAREDVERAIMKWGRFTPVMATTTADLIISVSRAAKPGPTVRGGPVDDGPVIMQPTDGTVRIGGQRGTAPGLSDPGLGGPQDRGPRLGTQIANSEDTFEVYRGGIDDPLDSIPVWRYSAKDALRSPGVPAVDQFRKLVDQAEKEAEKRKKSTP
jgi:hypothetical protein